MAAIISFIPTIEVLDLKGLDLFWKTKNPHPDIIIAAIDNKSIQEIGRWPWSRTVYADFLNSLNQIRAVGFDIAFFETEDLTSDARFAEAIKNSGFQIILSAELVSYQDGGQKELLPLEILRKNNNVKVGFVNLEASADGNARNLPNNNSFPYVLAESLGYPTPNTDYWVNYIGPAGTFRALPFTDILNGRINKELLKDKIILVGATASNLHDMVLAPLKNNVMAGIEWHANVLDNILLNRPIRPISELAAKFLGIILGLALLAYAMRTNTIRALMATIFLIVALPIISYVLWQQGIAMPYFGNIIIISATFLIFSVARWYQAETEKRKLRQRVQNYFSPNVIEAIIKDPSYLKLGGQQKEVSILFSDIRSFTTITEQTDPETLSQLLNLYFTEMTEEIFATDGVLDKFIGDAIMAFWGAPLDQPDHAERATRAAVNMIKRLEKLQIKLRKKNLPFIDIGVGVNTGMATVGNLGSERRFDYTVIGDSVNLASRLEGLNKERKTHIIISESTAKKISGDFHIKPLGDVIVKGKTVPIKIFEVV